MFPTSKKSTTEVTLTEMIPLCLIIIPFVHLNKAPIMPLSILSKTALHKRFYPNSRLLNIVYTLTLIIGNVQYVKKKMTKDIKLVAKHCHT